MYCVNCRADVEDAGGYCPKCGMSFRTRSCPKGHVMDPSWTECLHCKSGKGRTLVESPGAPVKGSGGDFTKGATLLEGGRPGGAKGKTVADGDGAGAGGGYQKPSGQRGKKDRTVFDPGTGQKAMEKQARKLVGWLVTFSHDQAGQDYRLEEGPNRIGNDAEECDICIGQDETVSRVHAILMFRDAAYQIRDNDSTNGTYVNGEDIFGKGAVRLKQGDKIRVGVTEFTLYIL